ncbi:hypothetical protein P43SY_002589 [Pythium insidiosum]|uniref:CAMKK protein kinase n=1 Tax=Pythium insidiosum TaxID=114742 RepID=A0AAD5LUC2_PYTIN|nr:hypothetical protein P43SY_002589 [Pythium insidiosum]
MRRGSSSVAPEDAVAELYARVLSRVGKRFASHYSEDQNTTRSQMETEELTKRLVEVCAHDEADAHGSEAPLETETVAATEGGHGDDTGRAANQDVDQECEDQDGGAVSSDIGRPTSQPPLLTSRLALSSVFTRIYKSKAGEWKERWFVLESSGGSLIKCGGVPKGSRPKSYGGFTGKTVRVADVRALSMIKPSSQLAESSDPTGDEAKIGLEVVTKEGTCMRFLTKSVEEESEWVGAMQKLSHGFAPAVAERVSDRELLAGKYALVRELGRGASGIVSLYTFQGKPFAIKKFVPPKAKGVPNRRAVPGISEATKPAASPTQRSIPDEVRREIALLKKASHLPYVIQLHDVILDEEHSEYYLVMEYMGGGAIAEWDSERKCYVSSRKNKSMSLHDEKTIRRYTTHLLLGIQALHQNRLCHRDIKPENLMASEDHSVCKIGDLGVAHFFREEDGVLKEESNPEAIELWNVEDSAHPSSMDSRSTGAVGSSPTKLKGMLKSTKGTYQFLPPEALSGDEFDGFKADIWAVGVTIYALNFGYLPFFSNDMIKLFEKIEQDPLVFPADCQDDELKDLITRLLEKDPEKRISVEATLQHPWLHRHVDSKALQQQVRALKRTPALSIDDKELGGAVSVLQTRFQVLSNACRQEVNKASIVEKVAE